LSFIRIKPNETQYKISPAYLHIVLFDQTPNEETVQRSNCNPIKEQKDYLSSISIERSS